MILRRYQNGNELEFSEEFMQTTDSKKLPGGGLMSITRAMGGPKTITVKDKQGNVYVKTVDDAGEMIDYYEKLKLPPGITFAEYLPMLKAQENGRKEGFKGGRWYPHKSVENDNSYTIGYGHKIFNQDYSKGLTQEEVDRLLYIDLAKHKKIAADIFNKKFGEGAFESLREGEQVLLTDYAYNGVLGKFDKFQTALRHNDFKGMEREYKRFSEGKPLVARNKFTFNVIQKLKG
jgi:hypothetical protein